MHASDPGTDLARARAAHGVDLCGRRRHRAFRGRRPGRTRAARAHVRRNPPAGQLVCGGDAPDVPLPSRWRHDAAVHGRHRARHADRWDLWVHRAHSDDGLPRLDLRREQHALRRARRRGRGHRVRSARHACSIRAVRRAARHVGLSGRLRPDGRCRGAGREVVLSAWQRRGRAGGRRPERLLDRPLRSQRLDDGQRSERRNPAVPCGQRLPGVVSAQRTVERPDDADAADAALRGKCHGAAARPIDHLVPGGGGLPGEREATADGRGVAHRRERHPRSGRPQRRWRAVPNGRRARGPAQHRPRDDLPQWMGRPGHDRQRLGVDQRAARRRGQLPGARQRRRAELAVGLQR